MFGLSIWNFLGLLAMLSLMISFTIGRNAIWGGLFVGLITSSLLAILSLVTGNGINLTLLKKWMVVMILFSTLFEIINRSAYSLQKIRKKQ